MLQNASGVAVRVANEIARVREDGNGGESRVGQGEVKCEHGNSARRAVGKVPRSTRC